MNAHDNDIAVYFSMFPGQGMAMFRVTPCVKWRWGFIPSVRIQVDFGVSLCSPYDEFDFDHGKNLAWDRLEAFLDGRVRLRERGLAGSWTMGPKDWTEVVRKKREQEFLLETMVNNFPIRTPWTWERLVN